VEEDVILVMSGSLIRHPVFTPKRTNETCTKHAEHTVTIEYGPAHAEAVAGEMAAR
jgi:hypothetical protein